VAEGHIVRAEGSGPFFFMASGRENGGRLDLFVIDVAYRLGPPLHTHTTQEDSFYVIDGVLTVQLSDDVVEVSPGEFVTAPPGVAHTFTNARPDQSVRVVNVMTPGIGFDSYIKQVNAPGGVGSEAVAKLNQEYGVEMVGPSLAGKLGLS